MVNVAEKNRIEALLPFFVNGTLQWEDKAQVLRAVGSDIDLARQAQVLSDLREAMKDDMPDYTPGELGLARLMREVEKEEARKTIVGSWMLPSAGLAVAVALVMVLTIPGLMGDGSAVYEQASGDADTAALSVAFREDATQGAVAALLLQHNLIIIDGPSALGIYRVAPVEGGDLVAAAEALGAETDIVESVDTLQ
jgi:hypothetical protein